MNEPPAGLYLHIPFCYAVCPYCDFAVRTGKPERRRRFVDHLIGELELYAGYPLEFDTIYFGGGTPSLIEVEDLERIVAAARDRLEFRPDTRLFLEANPEDVTATRAQDWHRLGVETLSLGIQSLSEPALEFLGRRHSPLEARRSVELALAAGFQTVSIDLIYGLPGQQEDEWCSQLNDALELGAHHISCYQLTIHPRTRFALLEKRGSLVQLPVDDQADLFGRTHRVLNDAGMQGYEVSQFAASPAHRSRHNTKYWNHTPYLGLGPSAHSFHDRRRWWNLRRTDPWQERIDAGRKPIEADETLNSSDLLLEALMTGLRTYDGVDLGALGERFGIDVWTANRVLTETLVSRGLVLVDGRCVRPTLEGLAVADAMAGQFSLT